MPGEDMNADYSEHPAMPGFIVESLQAGDVRTTTPHAPGPQGGWWDGWDSTDPGKHLKRAWR